MTKVIIMHYEPSDDSYVYEKGTEMKENQIICKNCMHYYEQPHEPLFEHWADEKGRISGYCSLQCDDSKFLPDYASVNYDWHCDAFEDVENI